MAAHRKTPEDMYDTAPPVAALENCSRTTFTFCSAPKQQSMEETRTCDKCHKEVAEANFALHETHCSRFLCVCPDCDEPVPQDQLSQHREEQHSQVKCSKCHKKMEQCHLSDHQSEECAERLRTCPFCELEVPWKDLREHSVVCGCRTELCGDCGRYVQLRDLPGHSSTCSAAGGGQDTGVKMTAASPADLSDLGPALDGLPSAEPESCHTRTGSFPHDHLDQHEEQLIT
ncbi:XIAP-associated factor 1 [Nematolebias whitei]|uniref:XIAP-associated factor 1 n=1 Tax=Nematolebias whitei TaxID=451745 RepID=UPI00189A4851|nr:XIAP-associated factor 1 [Nematolebias whitei]